MQPRGPAPAPAGAGLNLAQLSRNKPVLFGGAAVIAVAIYAYVKHKGGGSAATAGIADGSTLAGTPGNPAALNTVGTDVASQLGQFGANQDQSLAAWLANLTSTLDAAKALPPDTPAGGTNVVGLDLSPKGNTVSVGTNANVYDFARSIYGSNSGINTLRQLNPGFDSWITWSAPDASGNRTPTLKKGRPVKT